MYSNIEPTQSWSLQYCCSVNQLCPTLCDPMDCITLGFPVLHHLPELAQVHVYWVGDAIQYLILGLLLLLLSIFPSIRVFTKESDLRIRWPKYWNFSISTSNEYSQLISFRIDWFDFLAVQGTLKSLEGMNSLTLSIFYCPALTSIHDYWKNHSLDYRNICQQSNVSTF